MAILSAADTEAVLGAVSRISAAPDLDSFARRTARSVRALVGGDVCAYAEVDPANGRQVNIPDPSDFAFPPGAHQFLADHVEEHPVIAWSQRTGRGDPRAISDFLGPSGWRRTALYDAMFAPIDGDDQISIALAVRPPAVIGIALNRDRVGFSSRDRTILALLRPHLLVAYRNVEARVQLAATLSALEASGQAVVVLGHGGRVVLSSPAAQTLLRRYLGHAGPGALPEL